MGDDGSADLQHVLAVAKSIGQLMQKRLIVVDKSTVPVGTADKVKATIQKELALRNSDLKFDMCF
jgi:UDPglucose 6-dehydrogenase